MENMFDNFSTKQQQDAFLHQLKNSIKKYAKATSKKASGSSQDVQSLDQDWQSLNEDYIRLKKK